MNDYERQFGDLLGTIQRLKPSVESIKSCPNPTEKNVRKHKLSYRDQRDLETLPKTIDRLDQDILALETVLMDPDLYQKSPETFDDTVTKLEDLKNNKLMAEDRLLEIMMLNDEIKD